MVMHRIGEIVMLAPGERHIDANRRMATGTPGKYVQSAGRGMRGGKASAPSVVMDFGGTHRTFCNEQAAALRRIGIAGDSGRARRHSLDDGWRDGAIRLIQREARKAKSGIVLRALDWWDSASDVLSYLMMAFAAACAVYAAIDVVLWIVGP